MPDKSSHPPTNKRYDFNYFIAKFFLENTRLTILVFALFVLVGGFMTASLKTTGFPSPTIPVAIVNTIYPGASSETINRDITIPLEGAIKGVKNIKRFSSSSANSVSTISISIDESANLDTVRSQIDSAVRAIKLPSGVESPKIFAPDIGGPAIILAITHPDLSKIYNVATQVKSRLSQIPEISNIDPIRDLEKKVLIKLDYNKLREAGITVDQISAKVSSLGESLPVVNNVSIGNENATITTSLSKNSLSDLENLVFKTAPVIPTGSFGGNPNAPITVSQPTAEPKTYKLSDLASIDIDYSFKGNKGATTYALKDKMGETRIVSSLILNIKAIKNSDQNKLTENVHSELAKIDDGQFFTRYNINSNFDINSNENKVSIVEGYSEGDANREQVTEVVSGLIGGPINSLGNLSAIGWLFGGIQLVMIAMLFFVSWRASLIAGLAIPLSMAFSTIYLYLSGQSLNTLTLFSLVLVTGLVVDPALVVLEAIQRKIDTGLKGKTAVLEAIRDVGLGVFLAMLTNIIVFVPFGILSGIFGQIFRYIPLTIIPATIGSYLVPLVVLSWFGSLLLKKNKNASAKEEDNLWGIAKWLIALNKRILYGARWIRMTIIIVTFMIPLLVTGFMFSKGYIKQVQFASSDDADIVILTGNYLPKISQSIKTLTTNNILEIVAKHPEVNNILPINDGFGYYVFLKPKTERAVKADKIASTIDQEIQDKFGSSSNDEKKFYDLKLSLAQTGGRGNDYQITMAVKSEDLDKLKDASLAVSNLMTSQACVENNKVSLKTDCSDENKLVIKTDNGYTDRENLVYDVQLDRDLLLDKNLASLGRGPLTLSINQAIKKQFELNQNNKIAQVNIDGTNTDVALAPSLDAPQSLNQIKDRVKEETRTNLDDVGIIQTTTPKSTINRSSGAVVGQVQGRLKKEYQNNQGIAQQLGTEIQKYFEADDSKELKKLGLTKGAIETFKDGQAADAFKAFGELGIALVLAIIVSYIVLAVFFNSFLQALGILYTIPLTFLGVFPALYYFVGGQYGFLEIIGLIILIGIIENVAIFLIDGANQKIREEGFNRKDAIAYSSGVRFRPVMLTKLTALSSLAPLAILSQFYRSISVVIIFGLIASGFISLVTTPILYIFFGWVSEHYRHSKWYNQILFFPLFPIYLIAWGMIDKPSKPFLNKI